MFKKIILFLLIIVGCISKNNKDEFSPQKILSKYVEKSFNLKSIDERRELEQYLTDEALEIVRSMDSSAFEKNFLQKNREFISLKITSEQKNSETKYSIAYEITYYEKNANPLDNKISKNKVTNKKYAIFIKKDNKWYISDVKNLKTFIEHEDELSL
jgi:hypothetical protein